MGASYADQGAIPSTHQEITEAPVPRPPALFTMDSTVEKAIGARLQGKPFLAAEAKNVSAEVNQGVVTLSGSIPSEQARRDVLQAIALIPGVDRIDDRLKIQP